MKLAPAAGEVIVIVGGLLSTRLPPMGPAVVHPPCVLHTSRLPVTASSVSVPAGIPAHNPKVAFRSIANPDSGSVAVHATPTPHLCHRPSAAPHATCGALASGG